MFHSYAVFIMNPLTKASDTELSYFLWSAPEQTAEQTLVAPVIRNVIAQIVTSR